MGKTHTESNQDGKGENTKSVSLPVKSNITFLGEDIKKIFKACKPTGEEIRVGRKKKKGIPLTYQEQMNYNSFEIKNNLLNALEPSVKQIVVNMLNGEVNRLKNNSGATSEAKYHSFESELKKGTSNSSLGFDESIQEIFKVCMPTKEEFTANAMNNQLKQGRLTKMLTTKQVLNLGCYQIKNAYFQGLASEVKTIVEPMMQEAFKKWQGSIESNLSVLAQVPDRKRKANDTRAKSHNKTKPKTNELAQFKMG